MTILSRLYSRLTSPSGTAVYLGRALGEIALIVLGILIAIQVDNWNQNRQERQQEQRYIKSLLEDLRFDMTRSSQWFDRFDAKVAGLQAGKDYYFGDSTGGETPQLLLDIGMGGMGSRGQALLVTPTFRELISTGNLRYIRDDKVKAEILEYYAYKEFMEAYTGNIRTGFADYVNASRPFSPGGSLEDDERDLPIAFARFKRPEFLELINQELTFAYSVNRIMGQQIEDGQSLIALLEYYLDSF